MFNTQPNPPPLCTGSIACTSADCGLWYERRKAWHELQTVAGMAEAGAKQLADGDEDLT